METLEKYRPVQMQSGFPRLRYIRGVELLGDLIASIASVPRKIPALSPLYPDCEYITSARHSLATLENRSIEYLRPAAFRSGFEYSVSSRSCGRA
jgi:hypothetical protein